MFYRRKLLLSLLDKVGEPLTVIQLQKLLFLVSLEQGEPPTFEFIPSMNGCYSLTINSDQEILIKDGLLSIQEDISTKRNSRLSLDQKAFTELNIKLEESDNEILTSLAEKYKDCSTDELITLTGELDPFYTIKSDWLDQYTFSKGFYTKQDSIIKEIESSPKALYTMGYEGVSIEKFINRLIRKNIKAVVDVRGNPNSRKRDFAKNQFAEYLNEVGIDYVPMPEVGVPNKIKREYLQADRREDLFAWHEANILAKNPEYIEKISGGNIVFLIDGQYAHNNPAIRRAWEVYKTEKDDAIKMQCLITGEIEPVARLHPSIKGVKGAQAVGASIVSFNARSYESYGRDDAQGLNAPISEYATFAYTTALNQLLRDGRHKQSFGDTTVVYWAMSPKKIYQDILAFFLNPVAEEGTNGDMAVDTKAESGIHALFQKFVAGEQTKDFSADIDPNTRFYILGLAPMRPGFLSDFLLRIPLAILWIILPRTTGIWKSKKRPRISPIYPYGS